MIVLLKSNISCLSFEYLFLIFIKLSSNFELPSNKYRIHLSFNFSIGTTFFISLLPSALSIKPKKFSVESPMFAPKSYIAKNILRGFCTTYSSYFSLIYG
jgi:hypothetical protein